VRFSVSNRGTDATAVERTIGAVRIALDAVRSAAAPTPAE
jgi:hypothetical protein